jgi:hypothetical protein
VTRRGANCSNIASATSTTYTLTSADVGSTLVVSVTATNTAGQATAVVAPSNGREPAARR